jgi:tetratricopeptide (TPR) repeat protein
LALGRRILERYRISEALPWQEPAVVHALSVDEKQRLHDDLGELLLVMAGATARQAKRSGEPAMRQEWLLEAQRLNRLAEECYSPLTSPRALWRQRAGLARLAGHTEEAQRLLETAETIPLRNVRDRYLLIADELQPGTRRQTVLFLREACRREPDNFTWWLLLGNCQAALGQPAQAAASYDRALALWPKAHWVYFNRGILYLEQLKDYRQACEDFDQFLALKPDVPAAYYNRALARYSLRDWAGAHADLSYLLETAKPPLRAYFLRAKVRDKMGDAAGAQQDRSEGLRREPADDKDWIARGVVNLAREPQAALSDFRKAREFNPHSRMALQNLAHLLGEKLGRAREAIQALDELIELDPNYVHARASRGVYLARLGQRDPALLDAKESLLRSTQPATLYQVAGIYALTTRQNSDDRWEAFRLLSSALRKGYGFDLLAQDRDLDPIRDYPEFRRLVDAAQALRPVAPRRVQATVERNP